MARLTHERVNGIKTGYWSAAKKEDIVQRLGPIENSGVGLILAACVKLCPHKGPFNPRDPFCAGCPLATLSRLVDPES